MALGGPVRYEGGVQPPVPKVVPVQRLGQWSHSSFMVGAHLIFDEYHSVRRSRRTTTSLSEMGCTISRSLKMCMRTVKFRVQC